METESLLILLCILGVAKWAQMGTFRTAEKYSKMPIYLGESTSGDVGPDNHSTV